MGRLGLLTDFACQGAPPRAPGHPERPERITAALAGVDTSGASVISLPIAQADRSDLLQVHTADHIDTIAQTCHDSLPYPDPDIRVVPESWPAALHAAGSGICAAKALLSKDIDQAFCVVRPPGHHCEADRAMGFCLFNNIVVAARWLQREGGGKANRHTRLGCAPRQWNPAHDLRRQKTSTTSAFINPLSIPEPARKKNAARTTPLKHPHARRLRR